jgi:hypothetical protein
MPFFFFFFFFFLGCGLRQKGDLAGGAAGKRAALDNFAWSAWSYSVAVPNYATV